MEQTIKSTLKRWENSLVRFGKIDQWNISEDYAALNTFIFSGKYKEARNAIRDCRDYSMAGIYDASTLLDKVQYACRILNRTESGKTKKESKKNNSVGQSKRFLSITKKLYNEKLRFKDGENLRGIDISIEDGATSRMVRRIVEKRMCQAYYRQHKEDDDHGARDRHYMKRATSFQLHNLGQIECAVGLCRTESTHWKKMYDPATGKKVFKKKDEYSSYEEASDAANEFALRHPEDKRQVNAYKCAHCGKWHIGHYTPEDEKNIMTWLHFGDMLHKRYKC
ncbi:MAG: hypothetical protein IKO75_00200 [Bacteroidales bacterium]|nr:hypothetical protein [Bacteroidales bacterium]